MKRLYAIRGAACALNTKDSISEQTVALCKKIFEMNNVNSADIVSMHFTLTKDLNKANPCFCFRTGCKDFDVSKIPLFCSQEAYIKGGLKKVIRLMLSVYLEEESEIKNVYINGAEKLRPDFSKENS